MKRWVDGSVAEVGGFRGTGGGFCIAGHGFCIAGHLLLGAVELEDVEASINYSLMRLESGDLGSSLMRSESEDLGSSLIRSESEDFDRCSTRKGDGCSVGR